MAFFSPLRRAEFRILGATDWANTGFLALALAFGRPTITSFAHISLALIRILCRIFHLISIIVRIGTFCVLSLHSLVALSPSCSVIALEAKMYAE